LPARWSPTRRRESALQRVSSPFRSTVPQLEVEVDRIKAQTLHVTTDQDLLDAVVLYGFASFVNQFNKFRSYLPGLCHRRMRNSRLTPRDIQNMMVRNSNGDMIPLGNGGEDHARRRSVAESACITLSVGHHHRPAGHGLQLRPVDEPDGGDRRKTLPPGTGFEWTAMSYQEKIVGGQNLLGVRPCACCWSISCWPDNMRAGTRRSRSFSRCRCRCSARWAVLTGLRIENNLYTQIGIILLIALSAKNAHPDRRGRAGIARARPASPLLESAVEAARARFRPILMTSFAFILGVRAAGARHRRGRQCAEIDRHHGVLRHAGFDVSRRRAVRADILCRGQRFENWLKERKGKKEGAPVPQARLAQ
jgi:HAE1 family hydrophobic/amphiphilic exporter-1